MGVFKTNYADKMVCFTKKRGVKCIFLQKYLRMSKKSSTFAPAFEKERVTNGAIV